MKRFFFILLLPFVLLVFSVGDARAQPRNEIRRIDAESRRIDAFAKKNERAKLFFADVSTEAGRPRWRRFASEEELERFRETADLDTVALAWRQRGRLVHALFSLSSESGDWARYDAYYYRADGSLAKISSELRTFYGNLVVLRDFYFDRRGKLLKKRVRYRDLNTGKSVPKPESDFLDREIKIYRRIGQLPFARLIPKTGKKTN